MTPAYDPVVAVARTAPRYPAGGALGGYAPVIAALAALGLDPDDPFGQWIGPGATVTLKSNWVMHRNPLGHDLDSLVTHPAVLFTLADLAARALRGRGTIVLGDAPLQGCAFDALMTALRVPTLVEELRARHPGVELVVEDWRLTVLRDAAALAGPDQEQRDADTVEIPPGYRLIDLGAASFIEELAEYSDRFRVTCYRPSAMVAHHGQGKHEYLVTRRVLESDLVINVPKLKTHIKAGLTGALKNLVGINGHKEYLPHHIRGSWEDGGDCYQRGSRLRDLYDRLYDHTWERMMTVGRVERAALTGALRLLGRLNERTGDGINAGSWSGNETIWRTTLDLNHVLYQRGRARVVNVVDGVIAGQGEGPLAPTPVAAGIILAGANPAHVDAAIARLLGYSIARVPSVYHALTHHRSIFAGATPDAIPLRLATTADGPLTPATLRDLPAMAFAPPRNWRRALAHPSGERSTTVAASGEW